ncbi:MAG: hybrid sensor histidine kinase/response regulator [Burkholderiales bacterium]
MTPSAVSAVAQHEDALTDLPARVDHEITRLLREQDLPGIVTNYGAALLVGWLYWASADHALVSGWVGLWFVANTAYAAFHVVQRRRGGESPAWRRLHLVFANVISVAPAGVMPWLFSAGHEALYLNTTLVVIYCAGIYASNAMLSPASYVLAAGTVLAPLVVQHAVDGSRVSLGIAAALVLCYAFLIPFARVQARALRKAIRVGYENEELAGRLARQTDHAEAARRQAEEANRAKARFLAAATHDLRQPLHALSLTLETLGPNADGATAGTPLERARECSRQLSSMFDALLDQAQLDAGTRTIANEPVPLASLFAQIEAQFQSVAQARGLWLRCRPASAVVRADRLALWRIASNLVTNALEATERGGVLVAWRAHARTLEVRDSGCGIAAADHESVFREFHRLARTGRPRDRGLGLGLATVRRLAALMEARVGLRSAPGRGSVFTVTFPPAAVLPLTDIAPAATIPVSSPNDALRGVRVLAVDDDRFILDALRDLLDRWACDHRLAASAAEAQERLAGGWRPDVLLMDRRLPDGDGLVLAKAWLQCWQPAPACLIITGDTAPDDLRDMADAGIAVLHKPVDPSRLHDALASLHR